LDLDHLKRKLWIGKKIYQLREYGAARVHQPFPSAGMQKYGLLQKIFSNRLQQFLSVKLLQALM